MNNDKFAKNLITYALLIFLMELIMISNIYAAEHLVLEKEIFLKSNDQIGFDPLKISKINSGEFIITGNAGFDAWARKINGEGKPIWEYLSHLHTQSPPTHESTFVGTAELSNGDIYLCGNIPGSKIKNSSGLLTRLNRHGVLINETSVSPLNNPQRSISYFSNCLPFEKGIVIAGKIGRWDTVANENGIFGFNVWHWLIMLDQSGKIMWEKEIPALNKDFDPDIRNTVTIISDNKLFISSTDNVNSELLTINASGDALSHRHFFGRFLFVNPLIEDGLLQIYGSNSSKLNTSTEAVFLNEKLDEIKKIQGENSNNFISELNYRMPDQSLILFGSTMHATGESLRSSVVYVEKNFQQSNAFSFDQKDFSDKGAVYAASPTQILGEFVTVRSTVSVKRTKDNVSGSESDSSNGIILNFFKTK